MTPEQIAARARILRAIRAFFDDAGFVEVETPVRIPAPAQEVTIDCPASGRAFLRASPELQMKRLLCDGCQKIYQIGPCFRENECGSRHNPEFTLLEWYRAGSDYLQMLRDTRGLLARVARDVPPPGGISLAEPWFVIPVREAYRRWAGWDPAEAWDEERFDRDMVEKVEPSLPRGRPAVLMDYPAPAASLAKLKDGDERVAERWEVYLDGIELANAYSELCDPGEQRARFEAAAAARRALGKADYPMDEAFFDGLRRGMPPSGGIALGVDRLVMLFLGVRDIRQARLFCQSPGFLY